MVNRKRAPWLDKHGVILVVLALAGITLAVYWPVYRHDFVFDDIQYVTDNYHVNSGLSAGNIRWAFREYYAGNWHPLTWLSHMLDVQLFGKNPAGHHLVNLFFHVTNTTLLFIVLFTQTKARWQSGFVAALFAVHPLHVESVAWVAERKDVLSTFFFMLTVGAYFRYVLRPNAVRYLLVCLGLILGLLSKPMLVTVPFVLLLMDHWPLGRKSAKGRLILEKLPLLALAAVSSVVTFRAQSQAAAVVQLEMFPFNDRLANSLLSYVRYIWKTVWPLEMAVYYPYRGATPLLLLAMAFLFLMCVSCIAVWRIRDKPYLAVGWFWYLGTLVPVIGIVQVGLQAMADRYTYIPHIGLFVMAAWGVPDLLSRLHRRNEVLAAMAITSLIAMSIVAHFQVKHWRNNLALYEHAISATSRNPIMENNLGFALSSQGRYTEAIEHLSKAVSYRPVYLDAHINLGAALFNQGDIQGAAWHFRRALEIRPADAQQFFNLGNLSLQLGQVDQAISIFQQARELQPDNAGILNNLGVAYMTQDRSQMAVAYFRKALQLVPDNSNALVNLGQALELSGEKKEALDFYKMALQADPALAKARSAVERLTHSP